MPGLLDVPFSQGYVSTGDGAKNAYDLEAGELVSMRGAFYRKNDPSQPWSIPGRSLFGSAGDGPVNGLAICQFDEGGTDRLLASLSTKIVSATPGTSGTFTDLVTGLNPSATRFTACHQDDRWYLGNGYDKNKCLKSDGTVRDMSLVSPNQAIIATPGSTSGAIAYPSANSGSFDNPTFVYDIYDNSFSSATRATPGVTTHTWWGWASETTGSRSLEIRWTLAGYFVRGVEGGGTSEGGGVGTGGSVDSGYSVTILFEKSEDGGVTWTQVFTTTRKSAWPTVDTVSVPITANSNLLYFRATLTYTSGTNPATLAIYAAKTRYGSLVANFDTTVGFYYTCTEYIDSENIEGPPGPWSDLVTMDDKNQVTLTFPPQVNTAATGRRIYRTVDGAVKTIDNAGLLNSGVAMAQATFIDVFNVDKDTQLTPVIAAVVLGDLSFPRDSPAPSFIHMISWNGSVVGISRNEPRKLRYSDTGFPESFPEIYVVSSFPLEEHDGLVGSMPVGETLVLLCQGAVLALDGLPLAVDSQFKAAEARPLKGHPGCVGGYAYTTFSVAGEPRGAWVSPFGVYVTNGTICACVSTDLAWESEVSPAHLGNSVLRWDAKNLILWFEFDKDGDGKNDHEMPFHMAQAHSKGESRPKLGQPTPKATSCMAAALIDSTHYRFSGDPQNGSVYVEEIGSGSSMTLRTGKITNKKMDMGITKATLIHSDFGIGQKATVTTTIYRDAARSSNSRTNSVDLYGHRGTTFFVGRAGEAVDFQVEYIGTGSGGILGIQAEVENQGRSGSAARWVSTSVTP